MLIKEAGCQHFKIGDATISQKHLNFFRNLPTLIPDFFLQLLITSDYASVLFALASASRMDVGLRVRFVAPDVPICVDSAAH